MEPSSNAFSVVRLILSQLEDSLKRYDELYKHPKHGVNGSNEVRINSPYPPSSRRPFDECLGKGGHFGPKMYNSYDREGRDYRTQIRAYYRLLMLTESLLDPTERDVLTQKIDELKRQFPEAVCCMTLY